MQFDEIIQAYRTDPTSLSLWKRSSKSWEFGANNFSTKAAGSLVFIWSTIYNHPNKKSIKRAIILKSQKNNCREAKV